MAALNMLAIGGDEWANWLFEALLGRKLPSAEFLARMRATPPQDLEKYTQILRGIERLDHTSGLIVDIRLNGDQSAVAREIQATNAYSAGSWESNHWMAMSAESAYHGGPSSCAWVVRGWIDGWLGDWLHEMSNVHLTAALLRDMIAFVGVCASVSRSVPVLLGEAVQDIRAWKLGGASSLCRMAVIKDEFRKYRHCSREPTLLISGWKLAPSRFGVSKFNCLLRLLEMCAESSRDQSHLPQEIVRKAFKLGIKVRAHRGLDIELDIDGMSWKPSREEFSETLQAVRELRERWPDGHVIGVPESISWATTISAEDIVSAVAENLRVAEPMISISPSAESSEL